MKSASVTTAAVALGSNLGDRAAALGAARSRLAEAWDVPIRWSSIYETDPVGPAGQGPYLNQAGAFDWPGAPEALLATALSVERALGRLRAERWGPRAIDIDLLLHGQRARTESDPLLPHPRMHERAFVLAPLAELLPGWRHPRLGRTVLDLLAGLDCVGVRVWGGGPTAPVGERR